MTIQNNSLPHRLIKFLITGGMAAMVEYGVFLLLTITLGRSSMSLAIAQSVSFLMGMFVSFFLNKYWSFRSDGPAKREFARYAMLAVVNLLLSNLMLWGLVSGFGMVAWLAKLVVMALIACWNFVIFQRLVFKV